MIPLKETPSSNSVNGTKTPRSNPSFLAYKRMVTSDDAKEEEEGIDFGVQVDVFNLSNPEVPVKVTICSVSDLRAAARSWRPQTKHWISIQPNAASKLGLAQAMIILKEALGLPPFAVLDALQGDCRVRLDQADGCVYSTFLTFFCDETEPKTKPANKSQHMGQVALTLNAERDSIDYPSSGSLMELFHLMMSSDDPSDSTPSASSRAALLHNPCWDRPCFFLTRTTCLSIWGSNRHTIPDPVSHWWEPASVHDHLLDRQQEPDYIYYKLVEGCIHALRPVISTYHREIKNFEQATFFSERPDLNRDVDQTLQLHLIVRELAILKHHMTPAERVLKQLLKVGTYEAAHPSDLGNHQLQQLTEEHKLEVPVDSVRLSIEVPATPSANKKKKSAGSNAAVFSVETLDFLEEVRDDCVSRQAEIDMLTTIANDLTALLFNLTGYRSTLSGMTLAGVAVVFLPLSWLCGVYGTNWAIFPELQWGVADPDVPDGWAAGYMWFWLLMTAMAVVCIAWLRWMRIF